MQHISWMKSGRYAVFAVALLAGGCASTQDLKHAQDTADQALAAANSAGQRADAAMAAANAAGSKADAASAKADEVSDKVDKMFAKSLKK